MRKVREVGRREKKEKDEISGFETVSHLNISLPSTFSHYCQGLVTKRDFTDIRSNRFV